MVYVLFFPKNGNLGHAWLPNRLSARFGRLKHGAPSTTTTYISDAKNKGLLVGVEV